MSYRLYTCTRHAGRLGTSVRALASHQTLTPRGGTGHLVRKELCITSQQRVFLSFILFISHWNQVAAFIQSYQPGGFCLSLFLV